MPNYSTVKKPYDYLNQIALNHKILRKQIGYSQQELAERSGVSLGSIKRFESSGQISLESLLKLAQILQRLSDFDLILKQIENYDAIEKLFSDKTRA